MNQAQAAFAANPLREPGNAGRLPNPKTRPCPRPDCQAPAGWSCRRWIAGLTSETPDGSGGYWRKLKKVHPERRTHRKGTPR